MTLNAKIGVFVDS